MENSPDTTFTAADHTTVVRAVLEHPLHVIKYLDVPRDQTPTVMQVLDAALQVRAFDPTVQRLLKAARGAHLRVEEARAQASPAAGHLDRLHAALVDQPVPGMIGALDDLLRRDDLDGVEATAAEYARAILIDGAGTIYSPTFPANELLESNENSPAHSVAQADAMAVAEAAPVATSLMSPGLALPYAAGTSAATAVVAVLDAVFG